MSKGYLMQGFITGIVAVAFLNAAILIHISKNLLQWMYIKVKQHLK